MAAQAGIAHRSFAQLIKNSTSCTHQVATLVWQRHITARAGLRNVVMWYSYAGGAGACGILHNVLAMSLHVQHSLLHQTAQ